MSKDNREALDEMISAGNLLHDQSQELRGRMTVKEEKTWNALVVEPLEDLRGNLNDIKAAGARYRAKKGE